MKKTEKQSEMLRSTFIQTQCESCKYRKRRFHSSPCTQGAYELRRGRDCSYWESRFSLFHRRW